MGYNVGVVFFGFQEASASKQKGEIAMAKGVKLTVNLSPQVVKALKSLAEEEGITQTEALRKAISTEKFLSDEKKKGSKILIEDKDKKVREVVIR